MLELLFTQNVSKFFLLGYDALVGGLEDLDLGEEALLLLSEEAAFLPAPALEVRQLVFQEKFPLLFHLEFAVELIVEFLCVRS